MPSVDAGSPPRLPDPTVTAEAQERLRRHRETPYEPIDFPIVGLGSTWTGPRWIGHLDGPTGGVPTKIVLNHGTRSGPAPRRPWVAVSTTSRRSDLRATDNVASNTDLASSALMWLMNVLAPDRGEEDRRRFWNNSHRVAEKRANLVDSWPRAGWRIGQSRAAARFARFAGGWAGFVPDFRGVDIVVVAAGIPPQALVLAVCNTSAAYHADLSDPLRILDIAETADAALGDYAGKYLVRGWHADQRRLLTIPFARTAAQKCANGYCGFPQCEELASYSLSVRAPVEVFETTWPAG